MNILFADDNPQVRELTTLELHSAGYDLTLVRNGTELLKIVEHGPGTFDVIVTDNSMPGGPQGIDVLRTLRADDRFRQVPIVVYTSNTEPSFVTEVVAYGGIYVEKFGRGDASLTNVIARMTP